jgi:hypothetical protein
MTTTTKPASGASAAVVTRAAGAGRNLALATIGFMVNFGDGRCSVRSVRVSKSDSG